ncbi:hypothetical protein ABMY26_19540 [Azospirillum sp. HJ39]|uniref:hypothetical protein n=1 Tax=Azospirillum sp. HJ39 TaxID=3159496 RepID=UPI0035585A8A
MPNDPLPHPGAVPRERILRDRRLTETRAGTLGRIPADALPDTPRTDLPTRHGRRPY